MRKGLKLFSIAIALAVVLSGSAVYILGPAASGLDQGLGTPDGDRNKGITDPDDPADPTPDVCGTTTLETSKETVGFWDKKVIYDWSIDKYVIESEEVSVSDQGRLGTAIVPEGETVTVDYLLDAKRFVLEEKELVGVRGYVCVKNTGDCPTENLAIVDHLQVYDEEACAYVDVAVFGVDTSSRPVLQPGEEHAYYFEYYLDGPIASEYCNLACVSITNHEGYDGVNHYVPAYDAFEMPSEPCLIEIDETASVVDAVYCPENFECVPSDNGPWVLYDSELIYLSAEVTNLNADCEQERCLINKATLTELDTCQVREDCAYVNLVTGPCPCLTTITVEKTAELRWEKIVEYDWTVDKRFEVQKGPAVGRMAIQAPDLYLGPGQTSKICYEITADREIVDVTDEFWLEGSVRVCNTGDCPTEGLIVEDVFVVVYNEVVHEFEIEIDMSDKPVLGPGECYDYEYEVDVTEFLLGILGEQNGERAVQSALDMSNNARAGITNFEGQEGPYFVYDDVDVVLPEPEVEYIDATATLTDLETVPDGFDVDIVDALWYLDGPGTIRFCKNITNVDAECGRTYYLNDTARLVENDTKEARTDDASVVVETPECERGITLDISKTVNAAWNRTIEYDWSLEKSVNQTALVLDKGEIGYLQYTLTATRSVESFDESIEVWGTVTVTNNGPFTTEGLKVIDTLFIDIEGGLVELKVLDLTSQKSSLASGETFVYYYSTDVTQEIAQALGGDLLPNDLSQYEFKNFGNATVTNYAGHLGVEWGVKAIENFDLTTPNMVEIDETATLTDEFDVPEGFAIDGEELGPWYLTGSDVIVFNVTLTNVIGECGSTYYLNNTAKLVEDDSDVEHEDDASVVITTPECHVCGGCTYTIGKWKNWDGNGPQPDLITPLITKAGGTIWLGTPNGAKSIAVTSASQASDIISNAGGGNKFNQLYAQMLAAKLNVLNGACDDAIEATMAAADAFLTTHNADDWDSLSKADQDMVNGWATTFEAYNSGNIGPGHCD